MQVGLAIRLLGGIEAGPRDETTPVAGTKLQALVALLALAAPHPVSTGHLIDALWGDDAPTHPGNALQAQISQLRRVLGPDAVSRLGAGYALAVQPDDVDAMRLESLVRDGREATARADHVTAERRYVAALALVRGPPLAQLPDHPFAREAAVHLDEVVLAAHEGLGDARLALGRADEVVTTAAALALSHPMRERFHAQLVVSLYRSGRQAEALRAYQTARTALVEALGVEPGPELQALERAVLAQDPSLHVAPAPPAPAPAGPPRPPGPSPRRLVGRDAELLTLSHDLADVVGRRGRVALLGGEPGIGKTRLAEELAAAASEEGLAVVWGRCYEGRGAPAFWPWTQIVLGLLDRYEPALLRTALEGDVASLAQIAPEVKELVDDFEPPPPLDPESARFHVYRAVARVVRRLAVVRPVALVVDDLHWADESSLALLVFLASEVAESPVLVVATFRNVDPSIDGPLADALAQLARRPHVRRLDIRGLGRADLGALLAATGADPSEAVLDTVHRRTQGNPFFVTEILRLVPADGALDDADAVARVVPSGVRDVIRQRVARLPEATVTALTAASVLGQDLDLGLLASVLGIDGADVLDVLEPAIEAGVVIDGPGGSVRYCFSHGLVNETIADDLGAAKRTRLHQGIAQALEARHGATPGPHLLAIAAHRFHAVPAARPEDGIAAALRAAAWAQSHVAHGQAEEHLRAALVLLEAMPEGRERAALELEVQDQLSSLLIVMRGYSAAGLGEACDRMRVLCQAIDEPRLLVPALWRLSVFYLVSATSLDTAVALGEQLLDTATATSDPEALLAGHMALAVIRTHRGEILAARTHFDRALELSDAGHDQGLAAFVAETPPVWIRVFSAWNWWLLDEDERATECIDAALAIARREGVGSYAMAFAVWFASLVATLRRDAEASRRHSEAGIALAEAGGYGMCLPFLAANLGWAIAAQGDLEGGTAEIAKGDAGLRAAGAGIMRHVFPGFQADGHLAAGRWAEALTWADGGLVEVELTGERWFEAELHRMRGEALAGLDGADPAVEHEFRRAVEIATAQGCAVLRLRAEASLALRR